jgi:predicted nucleic acid-binding protein
VLVVDASVAVRAVGSAKGLSDLGDPDLVAPPLLWSEARSALHERVWRREIETEQALRSLERLEDGSIEVASPSGLGREAWRMGDAFGWARTYDAEYVALASLLGCRLVTIDVRLRRGADRLGFVIGPTEL